jgi:hypothetical protein
MAEDALIYPHPDLPHFSLTLAAWKRCSPQAFTTTRQKE